MKDCRDLLLRLGRLAKDVGLCSGIMRLLAVIIETRFEIGRRSDDGYGYGYGYGCVVLPLSSLCLSLSPIHLPCRTQN